MYSNDEASANPTAPVPPPGGTVAANARYVYLIGRLRSRQMTMEEATELFGLMQGMLRNSELARQAAVRAAGSSAPAAPIPGALSPVRSTAPPSGSDDLLLVGILAIGAGAGLLAAMAKRIEGGPRPADPPVRGSGTDRTG